MKKMLLKRRFQTTNYIQNYVCCVPTEIHFSPIIQKKLTKGNQKKIHFLFLFNWENLKKE